MEDLGTIVAGLTVAGAIAAVISAATMKGTLRTVIMGAKSVLGMLR